MTRVFDLATDSPKSIISELTYANYKYNRQLSPEVTNWETIFGTQTVQLEARYQEELKINGSRH